MENVKNKILVPVDFTEVANIAVQHAVALAKRINAHIYLLHVIEKPTIQIGRHSMFDNKLIEEATLNRLQKIEEDIEINHGLTSDVIAVPGSIFDTINDVTREVEACFVVMGTHGVKGMQYIRGSNALRVISQSSVPYLLTQKRMPIDGNFDNIIFPVDIQPESAQKADWAVYLAKKCNGKINIIVPKESDAALKRKVVFSLNFAKKAFVTAGVNHEVIHMEKENSFLADETLRYAEELKANLIMITTHPPSGAADFFVTPDQQKVITNAAQIPVLCINAGCLVSLQQSLVQ